MGGVAGAPAPPPYGAGGAPTIATGVWGANLPLLPPTIADGVRGCNWLALPRIAAGVCGAPDPTLPLIAAGVDGAMPPPRMAAGVAGASMASVLGVRAAGTPLAKAMGVRAAIDTGVREAIAIGVRDVPGVADAAKPLKTAGVGGIPKSRAPKSMSAAVAEKAEGAGRLAGVCGTMTATCGAAAGVWGMAREGCEATAPDSGLHNNLEVTEACTAICSCSAAGMGLVLV